MRPATERIGRIASTAWRRVRLHGMNPTVRTSAAAKAAAKYGAAALPRSIVSSSSSTPNASTTCATFRPYTRRS